MIEILADIRTELIYVVFTLYVALQYRRRRNSIGYILLSLLPVFSALSTIYFALSKVHTKLVFLKYFANKEDVDFTNYITDLENSFPIDLPNFILCFLCFAIAAWAKSKHIGSSEPKT